MALALQPKVLLLENVPGLVTLQGCNVITTILRALTRVGYVCAYRVIDAATLVPQTRRRVYIIGVRADLVVDAMNNADEVEQVARALEEYEKAKDGCNGSKKEGLSSITHGHTQPSSLSSSSSAQSESLNPVIMRFCSAPTPTPREPFAKLRSVRSARVFATLQRLLTDQQFTNASNNRSSSPSALPPSATLPTPLSSSSAWDALPWLPRSAALAIIASFTSLPPFLFPHLPQLNRTIGHVLETPLPGGDPHNTLVTPAASLPPGSPVATALASPIRLHHILPLHKYHKILARLPQESLLSHRVVDVNGPASTLVSSYRSGQYYNTQFVKMQPQEIDVLDLLHFIKHIDKSQTKAGQGHAEGESAEAIFAKYVEYRRNDILTQHISPSSPTQTTVPTNSETMDKQQHRGGGEESGIGNGLNKVENLRVSPLRYYTERESTAIMGFPRNFVLPHENEGVRIKEGVIDDEDEGEDEGEDENKDTTDNGEVEVKGVDGDDESTDVVLSMSVTNRKRPRATLCIDAMRQIELKKEHERAKRMRGESAGATWTGGSCAYNLLGNAVVPPLVGAVGLTLVEYLRSLERMASSRRSMLQCQGGIQLASTSQMNPAASLLSQMPWLGHALTLVLASASPQELPILLDKELVFQDESAQFNFPLKARGL